MKKTRRWIIILCLVIFTAVMTGCQGSFSVNIPDSRFIENFSYNEYPLERAGISLHLDRTAKDGREPEKNILLIHGVTYSSHEFDINYKDYSLVRFLTGEGYAVWRLDIAGFGQSEEVDEHCPRSDMYVVSKLAGTYPTISTRIEFGFLRPDTISQ